ncbi:hypothetical protein MARINOS108_11027 [Marinoscillum sp. 108]|nr:hypothetical protein MARINOS108_11027 [Marinoscillum sp. 108]
MFDLFVCITYSVVCSKTNGEIYSLIVSSHEKLKSITNGL